MFFHNYLEVFLTSVGESNQFGDWRDTDRKKGDQTVPAVCLCLRFPLQMADGSSLLA